MTRYDYEQNKLHRIQKETEEKLKKDNTITCYGETIMTDCNDNVSPSSIALRELIIYSDIEKEIKEDIQTILINYGMMFENEYERIFECANIIENLLSKEIAEEIISMKEYILFDEIDIMEKVIDRILLKYYKEYEISSVDYDNIIYEHHRDDFKYNFDLTYRDMKIIILNARDSGGNLDCFGYAHMDTLMNCVVWYIGKKLKVKYDDYCYSFKKHQDKEELNKICEDIYEHILWNVGDFRIKTY